MHNWCLRKCAQLLRNSAQTASLTPPQCSRLLIDCTSAVVVVMPKRALNVEHRSKMSEQHSKKKQKLANLPKASATAASAFVRVLQNGSSGFGRSVFLWTTSHTYLFNCPEGVSRLIGEHKGGMGRLENIFLTRSAWENSGGLPGMALSIEASGVSCFNVHGPPNVQNIIDAVRPYQDQNIRVDVVVKSYKQEGSYSDAVLDVQYVPLYSSRASEQPQSEQPALSIDYSKEDELLPGLTVKDTVRTAEDSMEAETDANVSVAFVVRVKPKPPKINVQKCMQLKVPFGPFIGRLQNGESITLSDGTRVTPEQVIDANQSTGPDTFLIIDVPSTDFLPSLQQNAALNADSDVLNAHLVVHFTNKQVYESSEYQDWMAQFSPATRHLVANECAPYLPHSAGILKHQTLLNKVHPDVFPLLAYQRQSDEPNASLEGRVVLAEPMLTYWLRGQHPKGFYRPEQLAETQTAGDAAAADDATLTEQATAAIERMHNTDFPVNGDESYPEVLMLGTGSAVPSKYRNVTGIWLNVSAAVSVLFDCGEGTYGQLYHLLGHDQCQRRLANLKFIFLSHMHQDHYIGIFTMLLQRQKAIQALGEEYTAPYILASAPLFRVCSLYSRMIQPLGHFCTAITTRNPTEGLLQQAAAHAQLKYIIPVPVVHAMMPYGVVIETDDGHKIVYSGDTRPCSSLAEAGKDAHLLIHEATMEDAMHEDAARKRHSTFGEALDIAGQMRARTVLLTHFSGRYPRVPLYSERMVAPGVAVAFDNMRVRLADAERLHHLTPVMQLVFADYIQQMQQRTDARVMAKADEQYRQQLEQQHSSLAAARDL